MLVLSSSLSARIGRPESAAVPSAVWLVGRKPGCQHYKWCLAERTCGVAGLARQESRGTTPDTTFTLLTGLRGHERRETKELSAILTVYKDVHLVCKGLRLPCCVQSSVRMTRNSLIMATSAPAKGPHSTTVDIDCRGKQMPAVINSVKKRRVEFSGY